jgi:small subunit ribosomal protein S20
MVFHRQRSALSGRVFCLSRKAHMFWDWNDTMANTSSAKKAARQAVRRTLVNKARKSRVRTYVGKVEDALASGDHATALAAMVRAEPELMKAAQLGVLHKNTASRKVSRLTASIRSLAK